MISIRAARPSDKAALDKLMWRASWSNVADRLFLAANRDMVRTRPELMVHTYVATTKARMAGFAALEPTPHGWELEGLFVDPDMMRQQVGSHLLAACATHVTQAGATEIWTNANLAALPFYHAVGFVLVDPNHQPGPRLRLDISQN